MIRFADLGALIRKAEHGDSSAENVHRIGVLGRGLEEVDHALRNFAVIAEFIFKSRKLSGIRKLTAMKEVSNFLEGAVFYEIIDAVAEVREATFEAFYFRESGFIGDDSFETFGVIRHGK